MFCGENNKDEEILKQVQDDTIAVQDDRIVEGDKSLSPLPLRGRARERGICKNKDKEILKQVQDDNIGVQDDRIAVQDDTIAVQDDTIIESDKVLFPRPLWERASVRGKKAAFTLAEVLITLAIIGVVAAMTIPTLVQNAQRNALHSSLKKSFSVFSQSISLAAQSMGMSNEEFHKYCTTSDGSSYINNDECMSAILKNIRLTDKNLYSYPDNLKVKNLNKTKTTTAIGMDYFINSRHYHMADGMNFCIWVNSYVINIMVDLNGYKKPNILGIDNFKFRTNSKGVVEPTKQTKVYTEEELEDVPDSYLAGAPCNYASTQELNGIGCAYYALYDISPEDSSKKYWNDFLK